VTRDVANELTREIAKNATERGVERVANESFDKIPSGAAARTADYGLVRDD